MIGSLGIIKGNAPIITLKKAKNSTLLIPLLIPKLAVADLAVLVPVHGADHGVYLCGGYLAYTCTYSTIISPLCPTLPGRWFITNWSSSAGMQPAVLRVKDILYSLPTIFIFAENSESILEMNLHVHLLPLLPHHQQEIFKVHQA